MSNSGAGGGPAVIPPVESLLFWKLQIVSFIFSRDGLAHCFSEGGVWQNTACVEFLRSIRQNLSEICLQPEKYLWIIGQKNCETSTMRRRMCANAQHLRGIGDLQKVKLFWVKYFLCRGLGTAEEWGWRGLDSYYYSIIIVIIIIITMTVTTSKRVMWESSDHISETNRKQEQ